MCRYISFFYSPGSDPINVQVACLYSHGETEEWLGLDPADSYEGHYLPDGIVECRLPEGCRSSISEQAVRDRWPTFAEFETWAIAQTDEYYPGGYDRDGYDRDGYDEYGYDRDGYDEYGYDEDGYDRDGYDADGYDRCGYNRDGYDEDGYDEDGYDEDGYDEYGYDEDGYDEDGYDEYGYDEDGYDRCGNSKNQE
jgi:hypothetical protein